MYDYIIRSGEIFDGSGAPGRIGDVAVKDGLIVEVGGHIAGPAREEIDASGAIVTPAWVDIHTHYDGQVTWDSAMDPSASHGVGTVVMGNCGVGFAPVPVGGSVHLIELMEGVEDIPGTALYEGMPWGDWETYPQYLDLLSKRGYALNVSSMIAHGAVRNYVMGERGRANESSTAADNKAMADIVEEALRAGAVGFSTSRIMGHRSIRGEPVPGTFADEVELFALAAAMKRAGSGVFQIIPSGTLGAGGAVAEHTALEAEIDLICRLSIASGRPATFTLFETADDPAKWREVVRLVKEGNAAGARVFPQVGSRPTGLVFGIGCYHPFMAKPTFIAAEGPAARGDACRVAQARGQSAHPRRTERPAGVPRQDGKRDRHRQPAHGADLRPARPIRLVRARLRGKLRGAGEGRRLRQTRRPTSTTT